MASGFSFVGTLVGYENEALYAGAIVAGVTAAVAWRSSVALRKASDPLVPDDKLSLRSFGEGIAQFVLNFGDSVMGVHNRKYLPFVGTVFLYILFLNLSGLIPGFHGPTGGSWPKNLLFNMGIAIVVFVSYHIWGVRDVGIVNYIKHFLGGPDLVKFPMIFVGVFVCCVEIVSHCVRIFSLSLRLFGNITGDHLVLGVFTQLVPLVVPVAFYLMGTFVAFIQAFVFMVLSMVYIRFATEHEHEEGH
jgi:F-type H+-transporting ATPase subunit a